MAQMIALCTPALLLMYSASEVMDDVSHSFHVEQCKRAIEKSENLEEVRHLGLQIIALMSAQRSVLRQLMSKWSGPL